MEKHFLTFSSKARGFFYFSVWKFLKTGWITLRDQNQVENRAEDVDDKQKRMVYVWEETKKEVTVQDEWDDSGRKEMSWTRDGANKSSGGRRALWANKSKLILKGEQRRKLGGNKRNNRIPLFVAERQFSSPSVPFMSRHHLIFITIKKATISVPKKKMGRANQVEPSAEPYGNEFRNRGARAAFTASIRCFGSFGTC